MTADDRPTVGGDEDAAVRAVRAAAAAGDLAALRPLLHPYLHWTDSAGATVRGRQRVLARLADRALPPDPPVAVELRDGQVYRWQEPRD